MAGDALQILTALSDKLLKCHVLRISHGITPPHHADKACGGTARKLYASECRARPC
jgi:hypothetical protein